MSVGMTWTCDKEENNFMRSERSPRDFLPTVDANFTFEYNPSWDKQFIHKEQYIATFGLTLTVVWLAGWVLHYELLRRMPGNCFSVNQRSRGLLPPEIPNKPWHVQLYFYIPVLTAVSDAATLGLNYLLPFANELDQMDTDRDQGSVLPAWVPRFLSLVSGFFVRYELNGPFWLAVVLCSIGFICALIAGGDSDEKEASQNDSNDNAGDDDNDGGIGDDDETDELGLTASEVDTDGASPSKVVTLRDLIFSTFSVSRV
jgi:hypothetical protein